MGVLAVLPFDKNDNDREKFAMRKLKRTGVASVLGLLLVSGSVVAVVGTSPTSQAASRCSYVKSTGETRKTTLDHPVSGMGDKDIWVRGEVRYKDCVAPGGSRFVKVVNTFAGYNVEGTEMDCSGSSQIIHTVVVDPNYYDQAGKVLDPAKITLDCNVQTFKEIVVKNKTRQRLSICETRKWPTWRFNVVIDGNAPKYGGAQFIMSGTFPDTKEEGPFRYNC